MRRHQASVDIQAGLLVIHGDGVMVKKAVAWKGDTGILPLVADAHRGGRVITDVEAWAVGASLRDHFHPVRAGRRKLSGEEGYGKAARHRNQRHPKSEEHTYELQSHFNLSVSLL